MPPLRFLTATALFDGHDAAINIIRRILQQMGAEVIHLGHNRSVEEVVSAALQEDVQGIAISSYQGGHLEYFTHTVNQLRARGGGHIKVFGGGGGVIVPAEIAELAALGVKVYSPEDGQRMGLEGMISEMLALTKTVVVPAAPSALGALKGHDEAAWCALSRLISSLADGRAQAAVVQALEGLPVPQAPVIGITGTGGAGKSSLTDEWIRRLRLDQADRLRVAVLLVDPSRRKSGGALLGDRIRMNAIGPWADGYRVYVRSIASRDASGGEISRALPLMIAACRAAGFDLVIVETPGIGQGDSSIVPLVDVPLYVMTPEYGAPSQLEKIDMLDFAEFIAVNKFDRKGGEDALRDVAKQVQRNRRDFSRSPEDMPVFGAIASRFNDDGVTALYQAMKPRLAALGLPLQEGRLPLVKTRASSRQHYIVPPQRNRYLADIASAVRHYRAEAKRQSQLAREVQQLRSAAAMLAESGGGDGAALLVLAGQREEALSPQARTALAEWPRLLADYAADELVSKVRDREMRSQLTSTTLSGLKIRRVALPSWADHGEILRWRLLENIPGAFPFTAGVFVLKRDNEDPTRMFAGEGGPARTNARFKLLAAGQSATRLSTAFDSVTLYGFDPAPRPDIYGKVGNSGVSIATLDDMKDLYRGFDLCAPSTSVSMTINGPAPAILAMFLNTAIDQQIDAFQGAQGRAPNADEAAAIAAEVKRQVRGTVQADILKEDQGQNTCIFSTEFSLKVMGDIAQYFIDHQVRNFYSASVSGYHIAEAGANPISQLAFTLANGFTLVEAYLARGMKVDDFAPNLSFFFSNGMEPEYSVIGRVARRIWAVAMKQLYGANERSQKLKYHIQTSGRSLHAQEIQFNDIRTTLQALIAVYDNCNSLHTNAFDEAITTPTDDSVRRALAIQLIINREWGLAKNENPNQGAFIIEELTDLVEEAVLAEFERISERGGVLGAMELGYQRGQIQEQSLFYEHQKLSGAYPIIGVNSFRAPGDDLIPSVPLARSTTAEKDEQLARLHAFQARHGQQAGAMLHRLQQAVIAHENVFAVLMDAVRICSLGQITEALFAVGGQYRRNL